MKTLRQSHQQLFQKVAHLENVIEDLSDNRILGNEDVAILQSLGGAKKDLLMRQLPHKSGASNVTRLLARAQAICTDFAFLFP